jgi:hypothetical protein
VETFKIKRVKIGNRKDIYRYEESPLKMKTIGIYPGNFQPAHRGHLHVYKKLKQLVGPETFIATTSKTPTPEAPLNFGEKENIWVRHGVPASHVVKVEDWHHPNEIFQKFSPKHTSAIFVLNQKELDVLRVRSAVVDDKSMWVGTDGKPHFFQPYKGNESKMESFETHGYVQVMDDNMIEGKPISTANVRKALGSPQYTDDQKKKFFQWAFGWFDIGLFQELTSKFKLAQSSTDTEQEPVAMPSLASLVRPEQPVAAPAPAVDKNKERLQQTIKEIVKEMLEEFMPPPSATPGGDVEGGMDDLPGEEERRKDTMRTKRDAAQRKAESERDLKSLQADLKWKEADIKRKRKDEIPNKRDEIDALNKAMASGKF